MKSIYLTATLLLTIVTSCQKMTPVDVYVTTADQSKMFQHEQIMTQTTSTDGAMVM